MSMNTKDELVRKTRVKRILCRTIVYVFAIMVAVVAFYPFFVMIISSTHDNYNIVAKINVLQGTHLKENFERLTQNIDLYRGIVNSLFLAVVVTVVQNYFTMLAAYAFSKFEFKGKNVLFSVVMVAMMLPGEGRSRYGSGGKRLRNPAKADSTGRQHGTLYAPLRRSAG